MALFTNDYTQPVQVGNINPTSEQIGNFFSTGSVVPNTNNSGQSFLNFSALPSTSNAMNLPSLNNNFTNALQGVNAIADAWLGFQNLNLARDSFNFNRNLAETNLANQANLVNQQLESSYLTRANLAGANQKNDYASLGDYMQKYAVSGTL